MDALLILSVLALRVGMTEHAGTHDYPRAPPGRMGKTGQKMFAFANVVKAECLLGNGAWDGAAGQKVRRTAGRSDTQTPSLSRIE
jgi:hypothetical protein